MHFMKPDNSMTTIQFDPDQKRSQDLLRLHIQVSNPELPHVFS